MKDAPCRFCCGVRRGLLWGLGALEGLAEVGSVVFGAVLVFILVHGVITGHLWEIVVGLVGIGTGGYALWSDWRNPPEPLLVSSDSWFECAKKPRRRGGFAGAFRVPKPRMPLPSSAMAQGNPWAANVPLRDWQSSAPPSRKDEGLPFPAPLPWTRLPAEKEPVRLSPPRRPWLRRLSAEKEPARLPPPLPVRPINFGFNARREPAWLRERRKPGGKD